MHEDVKRGDTGGGDSSDKYEWGLHGTNFFRSLVQNLTANGKLSTLVDSGLPVIGCAGNPLTSSG